MTGLPVLTASGGRTKFNRNRMQLPKSNCLDALVVGDVDHITGRAAREQIMKQVGRGSYARTRSDKFGFPRLRFTRVKRHFGFATGDTVRAVIPTGKKAGTHVGRVAVRSSGRFDVSTSAGIVRGLNHKHFTLIQYGNGWKHTVVADHRRIEHVSLRLP
jgi:hypothetical protein